MQLEKVSVIFLIKQRRGLVGGWLQKEHKRELVTVKNVKSL